MSATTVKVSAELRDRINHEARARGTTAASLIEVMLDDYVQRQRMEAFGAVIRGADEAYWDEFHEWDVTLSDGSPDE
ncbi:MAG: CopG family transcriptional regulator [Ancrocorticia sp.]|uniref:ribbon-helix-helix domain-containing protein n=1 Tax=Ancrocorticia sp. TaxID=2593684 RepID=UPI003F8FC174